MVATPHQRGGERTTRWGQSLHEVVRSQLDGGQRLQKHVALTLPSECTGGIVFEDCHWSALRASLEVSESCRPPRPRHRLQYNTKEKKSKSLRFQIRKFKSPDSPHERETNQKH